MAKRVELGLKSTKMEAGTKASGIVIKKMENSLFSTTRYFNVKSVL